MIAVYKPYHFYMAGMTVEEYERHKEFMLRMMRHVGLDKVRTVTKSRMCMKETDPIKPLLSMRWKAKPCKTVR